MLNNTQPSDSTCCMPDTEIRERKKKKKDRWKLGLSFDSICSTNKAIASQILVYLSS